MDVQTDAKRIWNFIPQACDYMNGINGYGFKTRKVNWMCDIFNLKMSHIQFITIKQIPSEEWNITGSMDKSNSKEGLDTRKIWLHLQWTFFYRTVLGKTWTDISSS